MVLGAAATTLLAPAAARAEETRDVWPDLSVQIFGQRPIGDGRTILSIDAPHRAEDAALVPVTVQWAMPDGEAREVRAVTLVIDANPSPVAARFTIGADAGVQRIATRVRIDDYTSLHAVAELSDGTLLASTRYVKAAGGCSAPSLKQIAGDVPLGTMRLRAFEDAPGASRTGRHEAQVMVRHPNYSGMQMDQLTRLYIPANFLRSLRVSLGDAPLFAVEGGISIAENPVYRFDYRPNGATEFRVEAEDSDGRRFASAFPSPRSSS